MWSMDYVQVPSDEEKVEETVIVKAKKDSKSSEDRKETTKKRVSELVKQMSINNETTGINLTLNYSFSFY